MAGSIYLRQPDGRLVEMTQLPYDSEDLLQRLLADHPNLLAGDQVDPASPRRWVLVSREAGVPDASGAGDRWSLDHLFLDQDGIPTLVEVKRGSDTRIRREVVGQMLDYAANATVHWPEDRIRNWFNAECAHRGTDPDEEICALVEANCDPEDFWKQVRTNLYAGRIRLIFLADVIPAELQRIIEFLNRQMDPASVIGIAVPQFVSGELQTLVPRVVGVTADSEQRKGGSSSRTKLTRDQLLEKYPDPTLRDEVSRFLANCERHGLRCALGDTGCSLRLILPGWKRPVSVAWLFPPEVSGWMGLTDLTLGFTTDWVGEDHPARPACEAYVSELERLEGVESIKNDWLVGVHVPTGELARNLPRAAEIIGQLCEQLSGMVTG